MVVLIGNALPMSIRDKHECLIYFLNTQCFKMFEERQLAAQSFCVSRLYILGISDLRIMQTRK